MSHGRHTPGAGGLRTRLRRQSPATRSTCLLRPALIAVYSHRHSIPDVYRVSVDQAADGGLPGLIDELAAKTHDLALAQGGRLPMDVLHELVSNLVHASFSEVVISILDGGNTVSISDRGPGIPDKRAAVRPGFTTADGRLKHYIRGVGSGLALVTERIRRMGGSLEIDDNILGGTVVTVHVDPEPAHEALAPAAAPAYNLSDRQLKTLLLTVELAPVGPTRIARELGVATSTAYRDLIFLEEAGLVVSQATGHRSVSEAGLAYVNALL